MISKPNDFPESPSKGYGYRSELFDVNHSVVLQRLGEDIAVPDDEIESYAVGIVGKRLDEDQAKTLRVTKILSGDEVVTIHLAHKERREVLFDIEPSPAAMDSYREECEAWYRLSEKYREGVESEARRILSDLLKPVLKSYAGHSYSPESYLGQIEIETESGNKIVAIRLDLEF